MPRRFANAAVLTALMGVICLECVAYAGGGAEITNWNTSNNGLFHDPANWTSGVPGFDDWAIFRRGVSASYTVTFAGSPLGDPGGPVHFTNDRLSIGNNNVTFVKTLEADYTLLNPTINDTVRSIMIGEFGDVVQDVAVLTTNSFSITGVAASIGNAFESTGTLNVNGGSFNLTGSSLVAVNPVFLIGSRGVGALNVTSGGQVNASGQHSVAVLGMHATGIGTAIVSGAGSSWNHSGESGQLTVGSAGTGTLTIDAGATAFFNGALLASGNGSSGTVIVQGAGSNLTTNFGITIANVGTGLLRIEDSGTVTTTSPDFGYALIGQNPGGHGTVFVTGAGATWNLASSVIVGYAGAGDLTVEEGGMMISRVGSIGDFGGNAVGIATVTGIGSVWSNSGELRIGMEGTGTLNVQNGGIVTSTQGRIGFLTGSNGTVLVSGAGSNWTISSSFGLSVGENGTGTLTIENGGHVSNAGNAAVAGSSGMGMVTVRGSGSTWTNSGVLDIASGGNGMLRIESGGVVSNTVGRLANSTPVVPGTAVVDGPGSTWNNSGELVVGNLGRGTLTVSNGGRVTSADGYIAAGFGSLSTATVRDGGAKWSMTGRLSIGGNALTGASGGTGTLNVRPGGSVSVAQETVLFSMGTLRLEGGEFGTSTFDFRGGAFQWTSGTLHIGLYNGNLTNPNGGVLAPGSSAGSTTILGNYTQQTGAKLAIEIGGTSAGGTYDLVNITGMALIGGELQLSMLDGFVPALSDTFTVFNAAGGIFGVFDNVTTGQRLDTADGLGSFLVHYGPGSAFNQNQIVLSSFELAPPMLPGDFDNNGAVANSDLTLLLNNWGDAVPPAPAGWSGIPLTAPAVNNDELTALLNNWGNTAGGGSHSHAAVPEPGSAVLVVVGLAAGTLPHRCRGGARRHRQLGRVACFRSAAA